MHRRVSLLLLIYFSAFAALAAEVDTSQADALYRATKWNEAREAYEKLVPQLSGNELARVLNAIAYTYQITGKYDQGIETYQKVTAMKGIDAPHVATAHLRMGVCYKLQKKHPQAIAAFQKAIAVAEVPPNIASEALIFCGWSYNELGQTDKAIETLRKLDEVKDAPGHYVGNAHSTIARLYQDAKKYRQAIEEYNKVLATPGVNQKLKDHTRGRILECQALLEGGDPFYIKPYVTKVGDDMAKIYWVSLSETLSTRVTLSDGDNVIEMPSDKQEIRDTVCWHHVSIPDDLKPGAVYKYTITSGDKSIKGSFRTAPPPGVPVTFCEIGDTQPAGNHHKDVAKVLAAEHPDFVIHVGDMTDLGSEWGRWKAEFFDQGWPYLQLAPIWPAVGNHDGGHYFPTLFDQDYRRMYYSFDYGDIHLVALDSYWGGSGRVGRPKQIAWLEDDLAKTDRKWKVVFFHVPMITVDYTWEAFGVEDVLPVFTKHGVDIVLVGHEHFYHRYLPIAKDGSKPFISITAGGGGPTGGSIPSPIGVIRNDQNHFLVFKVEGDKLEMRAKLLDGTLLDQMTLIKKDGKFQKEIMDAAVEIELAKKIKHLYIELLHPRTLDLTTDVSAKPEAGKSLALSVDMTRLPRGGFDQSTLPSGAKLVVAQAEGCPWKVSEQEMDMSRKKLTFEVVPPKDAGLSGGSFNPNLEVVLNIEVEGRRFEPITCKVRPSEESFQRIVSDEAAGGGLPVMWDFRLDPEDVGVSQKWYAPTADTKGWKKLSINAWWEDQLNDEYDGVAWYRATAEVPKVATGRRLWLEFGSIDESCWVYVNGKEVGHQIFDTKIDDNAWEKPRRFDITSHANQGASNVFVVKVQDLHGMGGIYRGAALREEEVNLLPHGQFAAMEGWHVWQESDQQWKEIRTGTEEGSVKVDFQNGKYVDEKSLHVVNESNNRVCVRTVLQDGLKPGAYVISLRARQRLFGPHLDDAKPISTTLALSSGGAVPSTPEHRDILVQIGTATSSIPEWQQLSRTFQVGETHANKPLSLTLELNSKGVYSIDEVSIQRDGNDRVVQK